MSVVIILWFTLSKENGVVIACYTVGRLKEIRPVLMRLHLSGSILAVSWVWKLDSHKGKWKTSLVIASHAMCPSMQCPCDIHSTLGTYFLSLPTVCFWDITDIRSMIAVSWLEYFIDCQPSICWPAWHATFPSYCRQSVTVHQPVERHSVRHLSLYSPSSYFLQISIITAN